LRALPVNAATPAPLADDATHTSALDTSLPDESLTFAARENSPASLTTNGKTS
jgi:hypothetical protein